QRLSGNPVQQVCVYPSTCGRAASIRSQARLSLAWASTCSTPKEPLNNHRFRRRLEFQNCKGQEFPCIAFDLTGIRYLREVQRHYALATASRLRCIQVYQREAGAQSMMVLLNPAISHLLEAEDALQNPERMFHLRSHSGFHPVLGLL